MYDPVLSRALFQNPSSTAQGPSAPSAKGTGITSMVTAPDQGAQQLRSFANPTIQPTIRGFADGGFFGGEQLPPTPYGEQGQNPGWGHEGQPMVMSREPVPLGLGPEYQEWAKQHASTSSGGPLEAAVSQATGTTVTAPVDTSAPAAGATVTAPTNNSAPAPSSRYSFDASKFMQGSVSPTAGVQTPYDMGNRVSENQMRGIASVPQPTGNFYQPSFADIPQGYADGGPVQHFQEGGVASMWDNFVNSLTIKEPNRSGNYRLPDVGLRIGQQSDYRKDAGITGGGANYVEPIDVGGPDAVMSEEQRNAVYMRNAAAQQAEDPRVAANLENDAAVRERQQATRDAGIPSAARIQEAVGSGASRAMLPRVLSREGPDLLEQQQREMGREADRGAGFRNIGQEARPPMPGPGIQIDTTEKPRGEISTRLADIKSERASQSAADRRENALMALMSAGFGMAAGKSRHALQNIAEGGQQGIGTFAQLEKGRREDENRRYLSALHEKEVALRERDLEARLPLIAAQTKAQEALPEQRKQMNEIRAGVAQSHAQQMADKAFKDIMSNPMSAEFKAISSDKTGTVAPAIKKRLEEKYFNDKYKELMLQKNDGLGIRSVTQPSE